MINYADILVTNYAGKQFSCGETYESIVFHDGTKKPSNAKLIALSDATNAKYVAQAEIRKLESQETPRRLAEALPDDAGGSADGRAWLKANRDKIIAERAKL